MLTTHRLLYRVFPFHACCPGNLDRYAQHMAPSRTGNITFCI